MASGWLLGKCASRSAGDLIAGPLAALFLVALMGLGIDMIIHTRRHMNGYMRSGGEMLREWNETQTQLLGLVVILGSGWGLYRLALSVWSKCFA